jgi:hypothetical protein
MLGWKTVGALFVSIALGRDGGGGLYIWVKSGGKFFIFEEIFVFLG